MKKIECPHCKNMCDLYFLKKSAMCNICNKKFNPWEYQKMENKVLKLIITLFAYFLAVIIFVFLANPIACIRNYICNEFAVSRIVATYVVCLPAAIVGAIIPRTIGYVMLRKTDH